MLPAKAGDDHQDGPDENGAVDPHRLFMAGEGHEHDRQGPDGQEAADEQRRLLHVLSQLALVDPLRLASRL